MDDIPWPKILTIQWVFEILERIYRARTIVGELKDKTRSRSVVLRTPRKPETNNERIKRGNVDDKIEWNESLAENTPRTMYVVSFLLLLTRSYIHICITLNYSRASLRTPFCSLHNYYIISFEFLFLLSIPRRFVRVPIMNTINALFLLEFFYI